MQPHLFELTPQELCSHVDQLGEHLSLQGARRVQAHVLARGNIDLEFKNPIKKSLQKTIHENFPIRLLKIVERIEDPIDKSLRYLFEAHDGSVIEAVRIPLAKPDCYSICLSSQVGCAMACDFCATGRLGLKRNLEPWEIIAQFWQIRKETQGKVTGAVFMGQGEPFHNYDHVIRAAKILSSPNGCCIKSENITISTVGLVPQIKRYTEEGHLYRLIISLTSAIPEKRAKLLPMADRWSLKELAEVIKEHATKTKDRVTVAWVLIKGYNSGEDEALALKKLLGDVPLKFNMIDVNDSRPGGYQRASDQERANFYEYLNQMNVPIVRRYSVGLASESACGMLAGKRQGS